MFTFRHMTRLALISVVALLATPAWAGLVTYEFNIDVPNGNPVTDLFIFSSAGGQDNLFASSSVIAPHGVQSLSQTLDFTPTNTLIVGVNQGDAIEGAHIIMFTNDAFALAAVGHKWSELFAPMGHNMFISLLSDAHSGGATSLATIDDFFRSQQVAAATFNPFGSASILQFSITPPPIGHTVPEPDSTVLLGLGLAGLVFARLISKKWTPFFEHGTRFG
ncbi:MAG: PEP-CTERM sorting domain-containing protein [Steroidobacteraceae bacterium]